MLGLCTFNFCGDVNALDPLSTNLSMTNTRVSNAIFDHLNITKDVLSDFGVLFPNWDFDTILDANFNGNIDGGNVNLVLDQIKAIRIKRRKTGEFNWVTLKEIPVNSLDSLKFIDRDNLSPSGYEFDYSIVPVMSDNTEGESNITTITTKFDGIFICDADTIMKMYSNIAINRTSVQAIGELQPIGSKYPILMHNSDVDYEKGSVSGRILNSDFLTNKMINRKDIVDETKGLTAFLKNKKPKMIKDWNGNIWLVMITGNPTITSEVSTGVNEVNFEWTERGQYDNQSDLYINNFTDIP